jgi:hypothetical protein
VRGDFGGGGIGTRCTGASLSASSAAEPKLPARCADVTLPSQSWPLNVLLLGRQFDLGLRSDRDPLLGRYRAGLACSCRPAAAVASTGSVLSGIGSSTGGVGMLSTGFVLCILSQLLRCRSLGPRWGGRRSRVGSIMTGLVAGTEALAGVVSAAVCGKSFATWLLNAK